MVGRLIFCSLKKLAGKRGQSDSSTHIHAHTHTSAQCHHYNAYHHTLVGEEAHPCGWSVDGMEMQPKCCGTHEPTHTKYRSCGGRFYTILMLPAFLLETPAVRTHRTPSARGDTPKGAHR